VSYDLVLLPKAEASDDPGAAYERLEEQEEREPSPHEEERLRELVNDLLAANPAVDLVESSAGFMLQLGYEAERPVVIDISAGEITMSWSYGAENPSPALEEVCRYLPVFERHGYVAYDPQLERLFDPDRDADDAAEIYRFVQAQLDEGFGERPPQPWWKRLLSGRRR
jgi:hypothetical protein